MRLATFQLGSRQRVGVVDASGGSLRDVQELAGHRSIKTTQGYIEGSSDAQRRLIDLLHLAKERLRLGVHPVQGVGDWGLLQCSSHVDEPRR